MGSTKNNFTVMRSYFLLILVIIINIIIFVVSERESGCVITCCKDCSEETICNVCYNINQNRPGCKCVENEAKNFGKPVKQELHPDEVTNSEIESEIESETLDSTEEAQSEEVVKEIPSCRPSCCPRIDCTKQTCPFCYRRLILNPSSCPCITIEIKKPKDSERSGNGMMPISSIQKQIISSQGKEDFDTREDKSKDIPLCRPSCCPNES